MNKQFDAEKEAYSTNGVLCTHVNQDELWSLVFADDCIKCSAEHFQRVNDKAFTAGYIKGIKKAAKTVAFQDIHKVSCLLNHDSSDIEAETRCQAYGTILALLNKEPKK